MSVVQEIEKAIAELPLKEAMMLKHWLNEFEAVRRYKMLKSWHDVSDHALASHKSANANSLWN